MIRFGKILISCLIPTLLLIDLVIKNDFRSAVGAVFIYNL